MKFISFILKSPILLGLCTSILFIQDSTFQEYIIKTIISSVVLAISSAILCNKEKSFKFAFKYSLIVFIALVLKMGLFEQLLKIDFINPFTFIPLVFALPFVALRVSIILLCALITFYLLTKLIGCFKYSDNETDLTRKISGTTFILYLLFIIVILCYDKVSINLNSKDVTLANFKEIAYNPIKNRHNSNISKANYITLGEKYRKLLIEKPEDITYSTVDDYLHMFNDYEHGVKIYDKFGELLNIQADYLIKNSQEKYKAYELKRLAAIINHGGYRDQNLDLYDIDKNICKYGGRCDFCRDIGFGSIYYDEKIKSQYEDAISFLKTLNTNEKRVAYGLAYFLNGKSFAGVRYLGYNDDAERKEYYKTHKKEIEDNITTIIKIDKQFKFLSNDVYYGFAKFYGDIGDKNKAKYYEEIAKNNNRYVEIHCLSGTYKGSSEELYKQPYDFYDNK